MKKVKILEVKKEALKKLIWYVNLLVVIILLNKKGIIDEYHIDLNVSTEDDVCDNLKVIVSIIN